LVAGLQSDEMARKPTIQDLWKRLDERLPLWILGLIVILLADEYIKEGYWFDYTDLQYMGTHEFIIAIIGIVGGTIWVLKRYWKNREEM